MKSLLKNYEEFYKTINEVCMNAPAYRYTGLRPPHLIINCKSEYEKQHILRYITEQYEKERVLDFSLATVGDKYLYYEFDGSIQQMKNTFSNILSCSGLDNHYKYIIGFDVSKLIAQYNENQYTEFFVRIYNTSKYATCVFFISSFNNFNSERFIAKLRENTENLKSIIVPQFTCSDLALIAINRLKDEFSINCTTQFEHALTTYLCKEGINNIQDVFIISEKLLLMADYSTNDPILDETVFLKFEHSIIEKMKGEPNNEI